MDSASSRSGQPASIIEDKSGPHGHVKKYKVKSHLGKGGFANVYRIQSIDSSRVYACKIIPKAKLVSKEHQRKLVSEIQLHRSLKHESIVRFERHFEDKKNVYILLEVCGNGSMMELSCRRKRLTEHETRYFMMEILIAIQFLHSRFIIHRDLKLGNILLDKDLSIKICDFGLAAKLNFDSERKTTICGTPNYTAPEILNGRKSGVGHSYEVDVWAIGVIMFTLLTGKPPFETRNIKETYRRIKRVKYTWPQNSDSYISGQAKDLISGVFTKAAEERPKVGEMITHPFFTTLPIPKQLPMCAIKREPSQQELFPDGLPFAQHNNSASSNTSASSSRSNSNSQPGGNGNNGGGNRHLQNQENIPPPQSRPGNGNANGNCEQREQPQKAERVFVIKHVDYTKKYGIGYILSDGCTGIYFNDSTKIVLHGDKQRVMYVDAEDSQQRCLIGNFPTCLRKKVTLLKHFADFLWKHGSKAEDEAVNQRLSVLAERAKAMSMQGQGQGPHDEDMVFLKQTETDKYCTLFKLSNSTVQVDFTDASRIMIIGSAVEYQDKHGQSDRYDLNRVMSSNKKDLKKRCKYTQQLLEKMAANN